jgi:hypothetical protein
MYEYQSFFFETLIANVQSFQFYLDSSKVFSGDFKKFDGFDFAVILIKLLLLLYFHHLM